ncbi:ArsR/SmtB family transcription factor [Methermicoccus shengliensis]|uniref:ArsR/SmtB family transcription factor n=1 Tax=Methermicoccus shengliensis TaxID=660064 RepID=UPI0005B27040|nr:metalloregulator ArsR/SmtB family transcription factor [Methermicoccus shengliensis]KUK30668.1 MAG: Regulatory protein ArsR [Methanosarcinales archeaon 56_1174]MDN5295492.1 hypothetical protein [Methanosarcinales archaeon]
MIARMKADIFRCLAHPTRIRILELLRETTASEAAEKCGDERMGELCVCKITPALGLEQSNVSQHLAILKERGLIRGRREGQNVYYSVANPKVFLLLDVAEELLAENLEESQQMLKMLR